jgi:hypothetical protein
VTNQPTSSNEPVEADDSALVGVSPESDPSVASEATSTTTNIMMGAAEDAASALTEAADVSTAETAATASTLSEETALALEQARSRLQAMPAGVLGSPFEPFKMSPDLFRGKFAPDYARASQVLTELNIKAFETWRQNAEATAAHFQNLVRVKTMSEAIALNTEFARKQIEAVSNQTRELAAIAGRMAKNEA